METIEKVDAQPGQVRILKNQQGPVGGQYSVEASSEGWTVRRWYFFTNIDVKAAKQFGVKLLYDPEFRQAALNESATWVQIQNAYLEMEKKIVNLFNKFSLFDITPTNYRSERNIEWAEYKLVQTLREIYTHLSYSLKELSLPLESLRPYLDTQYEAAQGIVRMIDPESDVDPEEVPPDDRLLECDGPDSQVWSVDDNRVDLLTFVDVYLGEYGPVVALKSPPEKSQVVKNLDWDRAHPTWNPEREVWELDFGALEYTIQALTDKNHTVRILEAVARLADIDSPLRLPALRPNWCLPTMKIDRYERVPSATDLLILPGIGPSKARALIDAEYASLPELAHESIDNIKKVNGIGDTFAPIIKHGAEAAVGKREPPAVPLTKETSLSLPESQQAIARLAAVGISPIESLSDIIEMYQTNLSELDEIYSRTLYTLYCEDYRSLEIIEYAGVEALTTVDHISEDIAEVIYNEAVSTLEEN
jgi:ERCC4-type nuclease